MFNGPIIYANLLKEVLEARFTMSGDMLGYDCLKNPKVTRPLKY